MNYLKNKKIFIINKSNLKTIDSYYVNKNKNIEDEINSIIKNFWPNDIEISKNLKPLLISHLNITWLRRLYIYYNALKKINDEYDDIQVEDSFYILDICLDKIGFKKKSISSDHSKKFYLNDGINWIKRDKKIIRELFFQLSLMFKKKIEVLYLNAGKLDSDVKLIPNSYNANYITIKKHLLSDDSSNIRKKIISNIEKINLSIPNDIVIRLIDEKILSHIPFILDTIGTYIEFIKKNKIKLVIASTPSHDHHLCLLVAAKMTNTKSLLLGHGFSGTVNPFLENFIDYQGMISDLEYKYKGTKEYKIRHRWFNEKNF